MARRKEFFSDLSDYSQSRYVREYSRQAGEPVSKSEAAQLYAQQASIYNPLNIKADWEKGQYTATHITEKGKAAKIKLTETDPVARAQQFRARMLPQLKKMRAQGKRSIRPVGQGDRFKAYNAKEPFGTLDRYDLDALIDGSEQWFMEDLGQDLADLDVVGVGFYE